MKSIPVAIIGGSTVGASLAVMLQRNNIKAEVFEAAPEVQSRSGGVIGLEHTALNALENVGVPQDEIVPIGPGDSETVLSIVLSGDDCPVQRKECLYPGRTTTWTHIQHALMTRLHAGTYHPGHRINDVVLDGLSQRARLYFGNGEVILADMVVFADGRKSFGRMRFDSDRKLRYAGYVAHRGLHPDCPPDLALEFVRLKTRGAAFNTWPIRVSDAIDGSQRVAIDWTFYLNETVALYTKHYGKEPTVMPYVLPQAVKNPAARDFVDEAARRLLPEYEAEIVLKTAMRAVAPVVDVDPPERMVWGMGNSRIVIIGDALGPVHPVTARGANAGIEQSADLTGVLRQHLQHGADLDSALHAMERRQLPPVACTLREGPLFGASMGLGRYGHSFTTLVGSAA
jgi:2,6-dihydroxypyridine 3-monooxygenase